MASINQPVVEIVSLCAINASVAPTAIAIPAADTWLPRFAVGGAFIRCSPTTKHVAASR